MSVLQVTPEVDRMIKKSLEEIKEGKAERIDGVEALRSYLASL